jgi:hydroxymethylpyrimidine kinase/phosphomethylpyrimidine kinase
VRRRASIPIALSIAGSDSGGGAGIQADLKTFAAFGVHGTTAVTCLTAQNPAGVLGVQPVTPKFLEQQLAAIFTELPPGAAKTGMLYSVELIRVVLKKFATAKGVPLVVDPVMIATSGSRLIKSTALSLMKAELFPLATLITPNLHETAALLDEKIHTVPQMRSAAKEMQRQFGCAVLLKGGHLKGVKEAVDIFNDGKTELLLSAPMIKGVRTHGTGCTYSAAITAGLALGYSLAKSVTLAKSYITNSIASGKRANSHFILSPPILTT